MAVSKKTEPMHRNKPEHLKELYDLCLSYYGREHRKMRLLDATDRGDFWRALKMKFPAYQILPDTNHVSYVKNNILASIYTVTKSARILPTSDGDKDVVMNLNLAMDHIWDMADVGYYQFLAGDRAALVNIGITQVGWDDTLTGGSGNSFYKGNITLKNVDPLKFMRDPFATSLDTAGYCMTFDTYHKSVFLQNPNYSENFKVFLENQNNSSTSAVPEYIGIPDKASAKDYYQLTIYWIKHHDQIDEIHVVNNATVLYEKENIQPSVFPFAVLYCNLPSGALVGTSEPAKIFANNVAYNLMDSIALTAEYKNQNPPKFINTQSNLNIQEFAKHGDEAGRTFIVNGFADKAVHYHEFPQATQAVPIIKQSLQKGIELTSGVDGRYTGRDTGSIITTGGTEEMLNRVTLIDTPKILMYEAYAKRLTQLILSNFLHYCPSRQYFVKQPTTTKWTTVTIDFPKINNDTLFNYAINISSELPKNKQRVAQMANMLMEKQMQYQQEGASVQLITQEEWLMMQDLPNMEMMLERMGVQRLSNATEEVSQVLFQYTDLIKKGMNPDDAILATADSLAQSRAGQMPQAGPIPEVAGGLPTAAAPVPVGLGV